MDLPRDLQATGFSHVGDDARSGSRSYTTVATPCQLRMQLVLLHLCGSALESLGLGTSSRRLVLSMRGGYGPEADDGHQCQCQHLHRVLAHRGRGQVALEAELIQCGAPASEMASKQEKKKETQLGLHTKREDDFGKWYSQVRTLPIDRTCSTSRRASRLSDSPHGPLGGTSACPHRRRPSQSRAWVPPLQGIHPMQGRSKALGAAASTLPCALPRGEGGVTSYSPYACSWESAQRVW